jgi:hypothetical protein
VWRNATVIKGQKRVSIAQALAQGKREHIGVASVESGKNGLGFSQRLLDVGSMNKQIQVSRLSEFNLEEVP